MLYSPQSGLCSGHRAFSGQVAIAQAGLGHPWPAGQAGGGSSSRRSLSLAGWAGQTSGVGSRGVLTSNNLKVEDLLSHVFREVNFHL